MKLRSLKIDRLPGIHDAFALRELGDGVHVIHGPNGIGKSSLCRAIEALLWSDRGPTERIAVEANFEADGEQWHAERDGAALRWQHNGVPSPGPALPLSHLHHCFFLRLRDLLDPGTDSARDVEGRPELTRYRSRSHNTWIAANGAILIQAIGTKAIELDKPGADGCKIELD